MKKIHVLAGVIFLGCGSILGTKEQTPKAKPTTPISDTKDPQTSTAVDKLYFMFALHLDVQVDSAGKALDLAESYEYTKKIVERATEKNIKVTIMFTPPWVAYIAANANVKEDVKKWKEAGHELAAHHHDVWHPGGWYGHTNLPESDRKTRSEPYVGDMKSFISELKKIDPDIRAGCLNDERHKKDFPDEILIDTCSGFYNSGTEGKWKVGDDAPRGKMEWKYVGKVNGIERTWLTHSALMNETKADHLLTEIKPMTKGVFGVVSHANKIEYDEYIKFLDAVATAYPKASLTASETAKLNLPIKTLTEQQLGANGGTGEPFPPTAGGGGTPPPSAGGALNFVVIINVMLMSKPILQCVRRIVISDVI